LAFFSVEGIIDYIGAQDLIKPMKKVGFAVIGLGWFGEKHVHVLSELPSVELVAVCSRTESRAREIAAKYGAKKWYTELGENC